MEYEKHEFFREQEGYENKLRENLRGLKIGYSGLGS